MTVLDKILEYKREEVRIAKANAPIGSIEALAREIKPRSFKNALARKATSGFALIAEIKKASPSKGIIREDFDPVGHAQSYAKGGAACISVLTDSPSFKGDISYLRDVRDAVALPLLRKDFMIDPYQVVEARAWGADCILLIMACLSDAQARELRQAAADHGLDVLAEVHDVAEAKRASSIHPEMIGINNRNLKTFQTDLATTRHVAASLSREAFVVSESGISTHQDLQELTSYGANAFLVGESLMRQADLKRAVSQLLSPIQPT